MHGNMEHSSGSGQASLGPIPTRWTREIVVQRLRAIMADYNGFPPSCWLKANGYSGMLAWIRAQQQDLDSYRQDLPIITSRRFVSRAGLVLRSWAEVSLADFFHARRILVFRGRKYPDAYATPEGRQAGWYDLEFDGLYEEFTGKRILIEVWGNSNRTGPLGTSLDSYLQTKQQKLDFNAGNPCFLGISWEDCYKENKLAEILQPFIGEVPVTQYEKEVDRMIPSALWSTADQVLDLCRQICERMPDNKLPPVNWFKRRNKYKDRPTESWEPLDGWHNINEKIKMLGGYMKIREMLGHAEHNQTMWTRELVIVKIVDFCEQYKCWPAECDQQQQSREARYINTLIKRHVGTKEEAFKMASQRLPEDSQLSPPKLEKASKLPPGVTSVPYSGRFQARICYKGKSINLGVYDTVTEAKTAREQAEFRKGRGEVIASASSRYAKPKSKQ